LLPFFSKTRQEAFREEGENPAAKNALNNRFKES
jgi:hypothetical protein